MGDSFASGASRLAGLSTRLFGWTPDQFWAATPAELATILTPESPTGEEPLTRSELDRMMERERNG